MSQLKINFNQPLLSGTLNGVKWQSMSTVGRAQNKMLQLMRNRHNARRKRFGFSEVGVPEMLQTKFGMTLSVWLSKKFSAQTYYESLSKYRNNVPVC